MSFVGMTHIKACRKQHWCHWCGERIEIGRPAVKIAGVWNGDFGSAYWHPECDAAFRSLDWKGREECGVDEPFDRGIFQRGSTECR